MNIVDSIRNARDVRVAKVLTPEWPCGHVHVRTVSHAERQKIMLGKDNDAAKYIPHVAAAVVCDENGVRLFSDGDAAMLAEKSAVVLDRIVNAWINLNAMSNGEAENIEKNS